MARGSRYRASEIKAGIWIFISLILFSAFVFAVTGSRFWEEKDYYRVRLDYVGGLEVGSPVRMAGVLVGKVDKLEFIEGQDKLIELTIEVDKNLRVRENTVAYLSFISITSEQHLELEQSLTPAPPLEPGDLIPSKELTTMDDVMETIGFVGDTLRVILSQVHAVLKPANIAKFDSIITGINTFIQGGPGQLEDILNTAGHTLVSIDSLVSNLDRVVTASDTLVNQVLLETRGTVVRARRTMAEIDSVMGTVNHVVLDNATDLSRLIDNLNQTSENLKELSGIVKDNPFLLIRAIPREQRRLEK